MLRPYQSMLNPAHVGLLCSAILVAETLACVRPGVPPFASQPTPSYEPISGTRPLTDDFAYYRAPSWSPDGRTIAAIRSPTTIDPGNPSTEGDVVLIDVASGDRQVIAPSPIVKPERAGGPVLWLEGGKEIVFYYFDFMGGQQTPLIIRYPLMTKHAETIEVCCAPLLVGPDANQLLVYTSSNGSFGISWMNLTTGQISEEFSITRETSREHQYVDFSLSPDGKRLLMGDADGQVFNYQVGSGAPPTLFLSSATDPSWSPDGAWIAYIMFGSPSDEQFGQFGQLAIADANGSSPRPLFAQSQPGGMRSPTWAPDGTQLALLYGDTNSNQVLIADMPPELLR